MVARALKVLQALGGGLTAVSPFSGKVATLPSVSISRENVFVGTSPSVEDAALSGPSPVCCVFSGVSPILSPPSVDVSRLPVLGSDPPLTVAPLGVCSSVCVTQDGASLRSIREKCLLLGSVLRRHVPLTFDQSMRGGDGEDASYGVYSKATARVLHVGQLALPQLGGHPVDFISLMPKVWQRLLGSPTLFTGAPSGRVRAPKTMVADYPAFLVELHGKGMLHIF
jgi:hypothetical protein